MIDYRYKYKGYTYTLYQGFGGWWTAVFDPKNIRKISMGPSKNSIDAEMEAKAQIDKFKKVKK